MKNSREIQSEVIKSESAVVRIKFFYVKTENPEEFVDDLEQLCIKYSHQEDFYFKYSIEG